MHNGSGHDGATNYRRDSVGLLLVNFNEPTSDTKAEPFVFLLQVQQWFFLVEDNALNWRVVLHKKSRLRRINMEPAMDFITLDPNMVPPMEHPQPMPHLPNLVGAIVLSASEVAMAYKPLRSSATHVENKV